MTILQSIFKIRKPSLRAIRTKKDLILSIPFRIVYYKSLSDCNWREKDYNWAYLYSNKILCLGWGGNKILFWITNMTNYYLFYVIIAIWEWIVHCTVLFKLFTS